MLKTGSERAKSSRCERDGPKIKHPKQGATRVRGVFQQPVNWLKNGINALLEIQILAREGNNVGITPKGNVFLAYTEAVRAQGPNLEEDIKGIDVLDDMRSAIAKDPRFNPLPAMLSPASKPANPLPAATPEKTVWSFWMIAFVVFMAYCVVMFIYLAIKAQ